MAETMSISEMTKRSTSEVFPNILISNPNDTLPVIVKLLEKGDMQLIVEFNGVRKVVSRISKSAINIQMLIRTLGTIDYRISDSDIKPIRQITDYLGCM